MTMNLKDIVRQYLNENGYDGLYSEGECACKLDDLFPCDDPNEDCQAGYLNKCDPETCNLDGDCLWHIGPEKE